MARNATLSQRRGVDQLIGDAAANGAVALVIDTTNSAASLLLEAAARREVPVAYVTGLAMRRAVDLYAGRPRPIPKTPSCSRTTPAETLTGCETGPAQTAAVAGRGDVRRPVWRYRDG